jgi:antitoxin (DNA-binding transcriptional repressor) of toxin-antitoxin stability system
LSPERTAGEEAPSSFIAEGLPHVKVISLSHAKANLSRYGKLCQAEPVIVTVNGRPSFHLLPLKDGDDLIDRLIEKHPGFRQMLQRRLGEKTVLLAEARRRLRHPERASRSRTA